MDALYFGNIGAGEIVIIALLVVLPIALLLLLRRFLCRVARLPPRYSVMASILTPFVLIILFDLAILLSLNII
jgi:F0F1-type ATP synthase membrane subunit a